MNLKTTLLLLTINTFASTAYGMDNHDPIFPCDWCEKQYTVLNRVGAESTYKGVVCGHVLCNQCKDTIAAQYPGSIEHDAGIWWCKRCKAFYEQKKKVCWRSHASSWQINHSSDNVGARAFIQQFGTKHELPDASAITVIPDNPYLGSGRPLPLSILIRKHIPLIAGVAAGGFFFILAIVSALSARKA